MEFRHVLTAEMIDPGTGQSVRTSVEVRVDPLTEHISRILPNRGLMPANEFDLEAFALENQPRCPFCPERINDMTPMLPAAISAEGRIAEGEAVLFSNLHAYSSHSSVSIYSPRISELAHGLVCALPAYAAMGFESFNLAIYGAPRGTVGCPLNLRIVCRSNLKPYYRSDSTFLDRLHPSTWRPRLSQSASATGSGRRGLETNDAR